MNTPSPAVCRLLLGRELRELREAAGFDREGLAKSTKWQPSKISRIEQGQATVQRAELERLLELFRTSPEEGERVRTLATQARKRGSFGKVPDWSRQYMGLESDADALKIWDGELVPGLLQTEEYARAIVSTSVVVPPADVDQSVRARMHRQALLTRQDPPEVGVILGEAALHREVGGAAVLRRQLQHLRKLAEFPNITLQILPFSSGEHAAMGTSFTVLRLDLEGREFTYAYLEDLTKADTLDGGHHIEVYQLVIEQLRIAALGPRETMHTLDRAITNLRDKDSG
ncbi:MULTISPECIES: helix-turn-helix transcriptional regulator [unclassified Actinopolyspora]|uniref:helix-turn-helix domain-containing protein n=1 Tax=unclassified Actinopolyspora TaxID=2639451 RepID=UPI0013F5E11A|nr:MULTISPECIES: helix-turn-helix transcriptional regulator [unclassified Actinopolyspora]NHD18653.1 helix-turn-helix domain-containing protein [Actinopolyspora sp. BKK2]NHE78025.1 helix-turn-helix domain-containing protein [Actinopolyspora sp. BKK1]